jgi:hypothetical protein
MSSKLWLFAYATAGTRNGGMVGGEVPKTPEPASAGIHELIQFPYRFTPDSPEIPFQGIRLPGVEREFRINLLPWTCFSHPTPRPGESTCILILPIFPSLSFLVHPRSALTTGGIVTLARNTLSFSRARA